MPTKTKQPAEVSSQARMVARSLKAIQKPMGASADRVAAYAFWKQKQITPDMLTELRNALRAEVDHTIERRGSPVRKALGDTLKANASDAALRISTLEEDHLGSTFEDRAKRAGLRMRVEFELDLAEARRKNWTPLELRDRIVGRFASPTPVKMWAAYDASRAANAEVLALARSEGDERLIIKLNKRHSKPDICDAYEGEYSIGKAVLPPFHPYCICYPIRAKRTA